MPISKLMTTQRTRVLRGAKLRANSFAQIPANEPAILIYDDAFEGILGSSASLTLELSEDFPFAHEAGVYIPRLDSVFITSNQFVPHGQQHKTIVISKLSRDSGSSWKREEIHASSIPMPNGGINDHSSGILFCAQGSHTDPGGLICMSAEPPYYTEVLVDNYLGYPFNSVNDVVIHSDGSIWFTDPIYGAEQGICPRPQLANQVYRLNPESGDIRVVADGFGRPNGICFSPDEQTVYITDTDFIHGDGTTDARRARTM